MSKFKIILDIFSFLGENKKWWLFPIVMMLILLGAILVLGQGSAIAPFVYTLF
jgi:hypothetical protein